MIHIKKKRIITVFLISITLLGGCGFTGKKEENPYVHVQDYTGQGFRLPNGEKNDKIAEESKDKVIKATEEYFLKWYKTKVTRRYLMS